MSSVYSYIVIDEVGKVTYFANFKAAELFVRQFGEPNWRIYRCVYSNGELVK